MAGCKSLSLPIYNRELTCSSSKRNTEFNDDLVSSLSLRFDDESVERDNVELFGRNGPKFTWKDQAHKDVTELALNGHTIEELKRIHEDSVNAYIQQNQMSVGSAIIVYVFALFKITMEKKAWCPYRRKRCPGGITCHSESFPG